jgi:hypothetical protein
LAIVLAVALVSLTLAACGGSSSTATSTSPQASASSTTSTTGAARSGPARFAALRECLRKNGVPLTPRKPGQSAGPTRAQFEAAFKKCRGLVGPALPSQGGALRSSPAVKQAYARFALCMREHGVKLPPASASANGPILNTKGLKTTSATFKSAFAKCRGALLGAIHIHPRVPAPGTSAPRTGEPGVAEAPPPVG